MPDSNGPAAYTWETRVAIALVVADHWSTSIMRHPNLQVDWRAAAHPLALVVDALAGEMDPEQLGIDRAFGPAHETIEKLAALEAETLADSFVQSITGCARCDGDGHADVTWLPLTHPIEDSDGVWTHWAPCPTNGQPILMQVRDAD
jgi:hypothetical protein